jgi:O-antigen/teichoic acid export membrane protein
VKKNILFNYFGRFWSIFSGFFFTPVYIKYLGIEQFSIISFTLVITGIMSILDAGISSTLSREFALKNTSHLTKVRGFATFEILYFGISLLGIVLITILSQHIAYNWLNLDTLDPLRVSFYLKIIGVGISFELLSNFYVGGLMGLEQQVTANSYKIGWGVARNALVIIPLHYYPSLELFFLWQTVATIAYAFLIRRALLLNLNTNISILRMPFLDTEILRRNWKFAGGILLIALVAGLNTQMDKLVISRILPITTLGYYILSVSLSQSLVSLVTPISMASLPRFTALYSARKVDEASQLYERYSVFVAIIVLAFGSNIIFFSKDLIWIWTGSIELAINAYQFIPYLTIGAIMLSFQYLPYSVAIANGYTRANNYLGLFSLIITMPGYWIMTKYFGAIGAAITYCSVQVLITPFYIHFVSNRFLKDKTSVLEILRRVIGPLLTVLIMAWVFSLIQIGTESRLIRLIWIGLSTAASLACCGLMVSKRYSIDLFMNKFKSIL